MTLKSRVRDTLTNAFPASYSNMELARNLGAPEASVRRATLDLYRAGEIENVWSGRTLQWKRRMAQIAVPEGSLLVSTDGY